jgi:hypothetical protein
MRYLLMDIDGNFNKLQYIIKLNFNHTTKLKKKHWTTAVPAKKHVEIIPWTRRYKSTCTLQLTLLAHASFVPSGWLVFLMEDVKMRSGVLEVCMGPYCRQYKSTACFFFLLFFCPWPNLFLRKDGWWCPKHTLEPCYYERFGIVIGLGAHYEPKTHCCSAHTQAQNLQNSTQNVPSSHTTRHILERKMGSEGGGGEKNKESGSSTFVLLAIRTNSWLK